jgi:lysozyme
MDKALTTALIKLEEGCRLTAYKDSVGVWTIGHGFNLEAHGYDKAECAGLTWTQEQADAALHDEIDLVIAQIDRRWPDWIKLDDVRQAAIVSSVYQLGAPGAAHFLATIAAIQAHDWELAARQMLLSKWARQTPKRAARNAEMIRTGRWPDEVNGQAFPPVSPAPAQSSTYLLPPPGLPSAAPSSPLFVEDVRPPVRAGIVVSKKLTLAIIGLLAVILNGPLGLGLNDAQLSDLVKLLSSYILGQAGVDAFAPMLKALIGSQK